MLLDWMELPGCVGVLGPNWNGRCREASSCQCTHRSGQSVFCFDFRIVCPLFSNAAIVTACGFFYHTHEHITYRETAQLTTHKVWCNAWEQHVVVCINILYFSSLFFWCCCRCVPLYNFTFIYDYLLGANMSFVDWWALQQSLLCSDASTV